MTTRDEWYVKPNGRLSRILLAVDGSYILTRGGFRLAETWIVPGPGMLLTPHSSVLGLRPVWM